MLALRVSCNNTVNLDLSIFFKAAALKKKVGKWGVGL